MIRKINLISFIFLFIFLIGTVSATTIENETQTINNDLEISDDENIQVIDNIETTSNEILSTPKAKTLTIINSPPVEMYYKDGSKLIATLTDNNNYMHHQ